MARSNIRTDEKLNSMLTETGHWSVNGQAGQVHCFSATLHDAIGRATGLAKSGAVVTVIVQLPFDTVVVPPDQISWLRKRIAGRELPFGRAAITTPEAEGRMPL